MIIEGKTENVAYHFRECPRPIRSTLFGENILLIEETFIPGREMDLFHNKQVKYEGGFDFRFMGIFTQNEVIGLMDVYRCERLRSEIVRPQIGWKELIAQIENGGVA